MISRVELRKMARAKYRDAVNLHEKRRYDAALYICGYAVEMMLKARICRTLKWEGFPENNTEFRRFQSLRTHDLAILLQFSGVESKIKSDYIFEWSTALEWSPELRYQSVGSTSADASSKMLESSHILMRALV